jgi:hypothetical protein
LRLPARVSGTVVLNAYRISIHALRATVLGDRASANPEE